jgi:glycosyltransferase involved in cell wall biosynthesis
VKVLLTTPTFPPENSGLGNAVYTQAQGLKSHGIEVVVATYGAQRSQLVEPDKGFKVERFNICGSGSVRHPVRGDRQGYNDFLLSSDFDVIVLHMWQNWATDEVLRYAKNIKGKKILFSHCISTNSFFKSQPITSALRYLFWRPYWWSLPRKLEKLDGIIFLADKGQDSRFDDLRIAEKNKIKKLIIPNSLSDEARHILDTKVETLNKRDQLIAVGSYEWQKGFDDVLRAYAGSTAKNKIPLKLFGQRRTSFTVKLEVLSKKLGIDSKFLTFVEGVSKGELLAEYLKSKLFLSGSLTECQPLVLLDANATGTPFVARGTGCIESMPGGLSFRTLSEAIAKIDELLVDGTKWNSLSAEGRTAAKEIYHPDRNIELLIKALKS